MNDLDIIIPTPLYTINVCEARNVNPFTLKRVRWSSGNRTKFVTVFKPHHTI